MTEEKRSALVNGKQVPGTAVRITRIDSEPWAEYLLSDGSILRLKVTLFEATRVDDAYETDGTPLYICKWGIMQHTLAPDSLKKEPSE